MTASGRPRHRRVRGATAAGLVVVASLVLPVGLVSVWLHERVVDTDAFVRTAGTVAHDRAVQRDVAEKVSTALIREVRLGSGAPDPEPVIRRTTAAVVASNRFDSLWEVAVRDAHRDALQLAEGDRAHRAETRNGRIAVNLDPVVDAVVAQLPGPIAAVVPPVVADDDIVFFPSSDLASAEAAIDAVHDGWWAVPLLSVVLFVAALAIASNRRRAALWVGSGIVCSSIVTLLMLLLARQRLVHSVEARGARAATSAIFDAVTDLLRTELWVMVGLGVALVAVAVVAGFLQRPLPLPVDGSVDEEPSEPVSPSRADGPRPSAEPVTPAAGADAKPLPGRRDVESEPSREPTGTPRASN